MTDIPFSIAPLERIEDFLACERLQQAVWHLEDENIPKATASMLIASRRYGGMVLGAFDRAGNLIGFLFGLPGRVPPDNPAAAGPRWQLCSRIMGVHPDWQGRGVGYRLKLAQREWALAHGYELVTWTYDPLEVANGTLNLGKLGAVCRCYLRDFYGPMADGLNVGLPSDRFEVAWWVGSEWVRRRVEEGWHPPRLKDLLEAGVLVINPGNARADGLTEPGPVRPPEGEAVLVEIPTRIQAIKRADPGLALAWRLNVRETCEAAFARGYTACDVVKATVEGIPRAYYLCAVQPEWVFAAGGFAARRPPLPASSSPACIQGLRLAALRHGMQRGRHRAFGPEASGRGGFRPRRNLPLPFRHLCLAMTSYRRRRPCGHALDRGYFGTSCLPMTSSRPRNSHCERRRGSIT